MIKGFSILARPLHRLKNMKEWDDECENAYNALRQAFVDNVVLARPDPTKPYAVHTDACDTGFGCSIRQKDDNGNWRVVLFDSALFTPEQMRCYSVTEKEAFALSYFINKHRPILDSPAGFALTRTTKQQRTCSSGRTDKTPRSLMRMLSFITDLMHLGEVKHKPGESQKCETPMLYPACE